MKSGTFKISSLLLTAIFLLLIIDSFGQSAKVLVQNASFTTQAKPVIEIKWYSQGFIYPKGINIYRRIQGETSWARLNATPIVIAKSIPANVSQRDEDVEAFFSMAKELNSTKNNGFMLLNLFVKSFQSADFSKLIGIQWDDKDIIWGNTYEYRITQIVNATESEIGISKPIQSAAYKKGKKVEGFTAVLDNKVAKLNWKPEEDYFYAVNIYRSSSVDSVTKKLNQNPIVLSEAKGNPPASDALYQDLAITEGTTYYYHIAGLDFFGGECQRSEKVEVVFKDQTPPPSPYELLVVPENLNIKISWKSLPASDLEGFTVYRSSKSDGPFTRSNTSLLGKTDLQYVDTVPHAGFYYYYVAAVDQNGNEGASERKLLEVKDIVPPLMPMKVITKADTGKIILSWAANREEDLMGYYVYRSIKENDNAAFVLVNAIALKDSTYTQVFAKNASNRFYFRIVAVDTSYNKSEPSELVSARMPDVTAPLKPIIKNSSASVSTITINWAANPEPDLKGYDLYRYTDAEPIKIKINKKLIDSAVLSYADTLKSSGKFYYQLLAVDETGNYSPYSDIFPVELNNSIAYKFNELSAEFNKRKKVSVVAWEGSLSVKQLNGFVVFRKEESTGTWRPLSGLLKDNKYEDRDLQSSTKYYYQVRAYVTSGDIAKSEEVIVKSGKIK